jgi:para-aminobenzoate synthetase
MGDATGPRSHLVEYMVDSGQLRTTVVRRGACTDDTKKPGATPAHSRSVTTLPPHVTFLQWIKAKLRGFAAPRVEAVAASAGADAGAGETAALPFEFWGGYVGYLGYELRHECGHAGRAPRQRSRPEEDSSSFGDNHDGESSGSGGGVSSPATASLVFADRFVAFDHLQRVAYVLSLAPLSPHTAVGAAPTHGRTAAPTHSAVTTTDADARLQAAEWVRQTRAALLDVAQCCLHTDAASVPAPPVASPVPRAAGSGDIDGGGEGAGGGGWLQVRLKREREQYQADIASCHSLIGLGETYEVCLTTQVSAEGACPDPVATYAELRRSNAAPYGALLRLMGTAVMSSSPERFIQVGRDGTVESKPIKGTCRRGACSAISRA